MKLHAIAQRQVAQFAGHMRALALDVIHLVPIFRTAEFINRAELMRCLNGNRCQGGNADVF